MYATIQITVKSSMKLVGGVCASFRELFREHGIAPPSAPEIVLRELLTNAILHGNREDSEKTVSLLAEVEDNRVRVVVEDQGEGFDHAAFIPALSGGPAPTRGFRLVSGLAERIHFNDKGNQVTAWVPGDKLAESHPSGGPSSCAKTPFLPAGMSILGGSPSRKLESLGLMAGCIAHDFNNMLNIIIGAAQLLMLSNPRGSDTYEMAENILDGGRRAADLVAQILRFSREIEKERQPMQLQLVCKEVLRFFRGTLPPNISLRMDLDRDCPLVLADLSQVHQVLMHLCANGYKAMRENGGVLAVRLEKTTGQEPAALPAELDPARHYVCLSISDTGHAMSPATLSHIFEPNFVTMNNGQETGLGLAMVKNIVRSHEGDVSVQSEAGQGTTFRIYLPAHEEPEVRETETKPEAAAPLRARVLVVDDVAFNARLASRILEGAGCQVTEMTDSLKALEIFTAHPEGFDVLITDEMMPALAGHELAEKVLALRPGMPVILVTGHSDTFDEQGATALGIRKFLMKPLDRAVLVRAVRETMLPAAS